MFAPAMELYGMSFPYNEQREPDSQARIMSDPEYHFELIYDEGRFVGEMLSWENADFIYVEHFCMLPDMRGRGCGSRALERSERAARRSFWRSIRLWTRSAGAERAFTSETALRPTTMTTHICRITVTARDTGSSSCRLRAGSTRPSTAISSTTCAAASWFFRGELGHLRIR